MKKVMLTGVRPTGLLHLGHYVGAFEKFIELQPSHENFLIISDLHMLTTRCSKEDIASIRHNARKIIIDCIGMGVDPENTTFYLQSSIPELSYIFVLLQNFMTVGRAKSTPSLSDISHYIGVDNIPMGLLAYPVLEAADIFSIQADTVSVGRDNIDHITIAREIVDRVNRAYEADFTVPECITGDKNHVIGLDGQEKMSKSLNNTIFISDDKSEVDNKVSQIPWKSWTYGLKANPIMEYLRTFESNEDIVENLSKRFLDGQDVENEAREQVKVALNNLLVPMRKRVVQYESNPELVDEILRAGSFKVRKRVSENLKRLKKSLGMFNCFE